MFYGKKFNVDTMIADDGNIYSGATAGIPVKKLNRLYLSGPLSKGIFVCYLE
jgi:hypothetical protein